jgi:hypothetical protein
MSDIQVVTEPIPSPLEVIKEMTKKNKHIKTFIDKFDLYPG